MQRENVEVDEYLGNVSHQAFDAFSHGSRLDVWHMFHMRLLEGIGDESQLASSRGTMQTSWSC